METKYYYKNALKTIKKSFVFLIPILIFFCLVHTRTSNAGLTTVSLDFVNGPSSLWNVQGGDVSYSNGVMIINNGAVGSYEKGDIFLHVRYNPMPNDSFVEMSSDFKMYSQSKFGNSLSGLALGLRVIFTTPLTLVNESIYINFAIRNEPNPNLFFSIGKNNSITNDYDQYVHKIFNEGIKFDQFYNLKIKLYNKYFLFFLDGQKIFEYNYGFDMDEIGISNAYLLCWNYKEPANAEGEIKNLELKYGDPIAKDPISTTETNLGLSTNVSETIAVSGGTGFYITTSSNPNIATASLNGNQLTITGGSKGTAIITITDSEENTELINVSVVGISPSSLTLTPQETQSISVDGGTGYYQAASKDPSVATVSIKSGQIFVTGVSNGSTTITITDSNSNVYSVSVFVIDTISWYQDFDGDGYGNPGKSISSDSQPSGYVSNSKDCNDNDININPVANDTCGDGIDQDCSGSDEICTSTFSTDPTSLNISKSNTANFKVIGGSGFYKVASSDKSIATIVIGENNIAQVTGKSKGTTTVTVTDSNGDSTSVKVNVTQVVKAIIVAGSGPYSTNYLWDSTLAVTKYAYKVLQSQGFTNDTIAYYAKGSFVDVDGDGTNDVDGDATNNLIETAITEWASDAKDVLIYMVGHGADGKFKMGEFEHLEADVLNGWIKSLESKIPGKVTFVYDACQSGSFISYLIPQSGKTRIMITSASKGESAYFTSLGAISFSNMFWTQIHNGADIKDAFINTKNSIEYAYAKQTPILDDNGNGIGNDNLDGENTENEYFGNGVVSAGDLPAISNISPSTVLKVDSSATIYAENVTDIDGILEVWAVITPPNSYSNDPDNPVLSLPVMKMNHVGNNRYEGVYTDFTKKGNYNIAVFAKDTNDNISIPKSTSFIQSQGENHVILDSALAMTIPCVEFQGTCYQITLDSYANPSDSSGFFWKLDINSIGTNQTCGSDCASMDIDLNMTIPKIEYKGNFYQIQLKKYNNLNDPFASNYWKLDQASVKPL